MCEFYSDERKVLRHRHQICNHMSPIHFAFKIRSPVEYRPKDWARPCHYSELGLHKSSERYRPEASHQIHVYHLAELEDQKAGQSRRHHPKLCWCQVLANHAVQAATVQYRCFRIVDSKQVAELLERCSVVDANRAVRRTCSEGQEILWTWRSSGESERIFDYWGPFCKQKIPRITRIDPNVSKYAERFTR